MNNDEYRQLFLGPDAVMVNVHEENDECKEFGCCLHNPTPEWEHMPLNWREDRGLMERVCECGIGHPDIDSINYIERTYGERIANSESVHGCCGKPGHCPVMGSNNA